MREFATAAALQAHADEEAEAAADVPPIQMKVAGRPMEVEFPGDGQVIYLTMLLADNSAPLIRTGKLINFIVSLLQEEDRNYISRLLLDKKSGFGGDDIIAITEYLIEEWTGNPTDAPPASSRSASSGTPRSTAASRRAAQRRQSPSASPGSAT